MLEAVVTQAERGWRLDVFVAALMAQAAPAGGASRSAAQRLVRGGRVKVASALGQASRRLRPGERVRVRLPAPEPSPIAPRPVAFGVVFEDRHLLVVDKPPGLAVHPGAGAPRATLVQGLLHRCRDLSGVGGVMRPGIVHRLDAGTSGLLVVAKHDAAHRGLAQQFAAREVGKRYLAVVWGTPPEQLALDTPYGRHPRRRHLFTSRLLDRGWERAWERAGGRRATTWVARTASYRGLSQVAVTLGTGRTHQIRVHLCESGWPVVGDRAYGGARGWPGPEPATAVLPEGLCLHACRLAFRHPVTGAEMAFVAPPPLPLARLMHWVSRGGGRGHGPA